MEEFTSNIAAEVMGILYNTDTILVSKIPYRIWEFLDNEAMEYKERKEIIDQTLTKKENLSDEAKAIVSLIYKDYFCDSDEEKKEINSIIIEGKKELEKEDAEKYDPFKDVVQDDKDVLYKEIKSKPAVEENDNVQENNEISEIPKEENMVVPKKWYQKLIEKIKSIFK